MSARHTPKSIEPAINTQRVLVVAIPGAGNQKQIDESLARHLRIDDVIVYSNEHAIDPLIRTAERYGIMVEDIAWEPGRTCDRVILITDELESSRPAHAIVEMARKTALPLTIIMLANAATTHRNSTTQPALF